MLLLVTRALGLASMTSSTRLSKAEEGRLALMAQDEQRLQAVKERVALELERPPTAAEWAASAGETVAGLQKRRVVARQARNELVEANVPVVKAIAGQFRSVDREELQQEGVLGLIHAVGKFDATRGLRFSTYASSWVKAVIAERLRRGRAIYLPQRIYDNAKRIQRYTEEHGATDTIATDLNVTRKSIKQASLVSTATRTGNFDDHADFVAAPHDLFYEDLRNDLAHALATLDDRQLHVIHLRYGLLDGLPRSVRDCADILHMDKETVRQICLTAFRTLRGSHLADRLFDYMR